MQAVKNKNRSRLIAAAMQRIPCDLTVENVRFVNVITGQIYPASVDVIDGVVVRVREAGEETSVPSKKIYDGGGRYLVPGFFDVHLHIESTMMIPENFGRAVAMCGTTTVVTDQRIKAAEIPEAAQRRASSPSTSISASAAGAQLSSTISASSNRRRPDG